MCTLKLAGVLGMGLCMMGGEEITREGPGAGDAVSDELAVTWVGEIRSKGRKILDCNEINA